MLKKIFFHSALYALPSISLQIVSLLMLPFITPHLSASDYGIYGVILAYISFIGPLRDLGFNISFVNSYFKHPKRWPLIWRALYGHLILWSILFSLIYITLILIAVPKSEFQNIYEILVLTLLPGVVFDTANNIANYYFRFSERPIIIATVGIFSGVIGMIVMYYCIVDLKMGYLGWFYSTFATSLTLFLIYLYPVFIKNKLFPIVKYRKNFIKKYLRVSLPMIPHNYSSYLLNSSDRVVMDWYKIDLKQVGLFNIAYRFGGAFEMIGEAAGMAIGPQYVKLYISKKKSDLQLARQLTFILMALFLTAGFNGAIWLKEVFQILIKNKDLASAYGIGTIILMGYCYRPMYWAAINKLSTFEKTDVIWRISFGAGIINVLLNLIFLGSYGIMAAAITTFISLMIIGFAGFTLKEYREMDNLPHYPIVWLLAIIFATFLSYYVKDIAIWQKAIISCASLIFIFYYIRKIYFEFHLDSNNG
ncbi:oligosaccharide flippase family protein [Adhaeribacter sp. BT258]|uniref:Oligosaccharide flippase family protein n=1 Tax=Adhaeribacter terrigena TaxID=2793070 RepID=A0ABS1BX41_9BACT|nr:oligosaccharide flippase family protein [Adhaeribacter terrigena]MBK0401712.1 oligosaccharide flippase family protein [Adhaeribacter terrigena]